VDGGGGFPLLVAAIGFLLFNTWTRGQATVRSALTRMAEGELLAHLSAAPPCAHPARQSTSAATRACRARCCTRWRSSTCCTGGDRAVGDVEALPRIGRDRLTIERFAPDLIGIVARYGYMERPKIRA
jgi:K+ transporter